MGEGHDFEPEWLKLVAQMVHPETNSLLVLYDDAQSINRPQGAARVQLRRSGHSGARPHDDPADELPQYGADHGGRLRVRARPALGQGGGRGRHPARRAAERGPQRVAARASQLMHSSKGLEFPVVFLPCLDAMPAPSQEVAAEAKLLYVAMTRAMERLHMTHHAKSVFVDRVRAALATAA